MQTRVFDGESRSDQKLEIHISGSGVQSPTTDEGKGQNPDQAKKGHGPHDGGHVHY
jgi:hypothetical protein